MARDSTNELHERIKAHAFSRLPHAKRQTTNLYLDHRVREQGETIGPAVQRIVADRPVLVIFADDEPLANFAHTCRYLLYDAKTGTPHREIPARLPPYTDAPPKTLEVFHQPVGVASTVEHFKIYPRWWCPIFYPDGNRYAILYSGMSNKRHLNDLEFCWRMLVDHYGFDPANIQVLTYDGTLNTQDGPQVNWPGDGTPYRIQITGHGDAAAFKAAFKALKPKLKSDDLLFIHTNNHGDNNGTESYLFTYPGWGTYMSSDFCKDLAALPKYQSLIVMMEQCNSGGFNAPVIANSTATNTSIASAAIATQSSYITADFNWDPFARDWIAAMMGHDPFGAGLASNPDTDGDGAVNAEEAFNYALSVQDPRDSPNFDESSEAGGDITLSQKYLLWWWWCLILHPYLERYALTLPPGPEFHDKLRAVTPELQKLLIPAFDRAAADVKAQVTPKIEAAIAAAFGKR